MGIVYGAMIANLLPSLWRWWSAATSLKPTAVSAPDLPRWCLTAMAAGVLLSGVRDLYAALGLPRGAWPWQPSETRV